jgi:FKBP-type peptidyl-prolyl cis-trans isomerase FkpA
MRPPPPGADRGREVEPGGRRSSRARTEVEPGGEEVEPGGEEVEPGGDGGRVTHRGFWEPSGIIDVTTARQPCATVIAVHTRSAALIAVAMVAVMAASCKGAEKEEQLPAMADTGITSLQTRDSTMGTGAEAQKGQLVRMHYTGWLYDASRADRRGQKFDSSKDRNVPFEFRVGAGEVIQGWDEGVSGMRVGGTRILTIPPAMGYGAGGAAGIIPPNATLVFEVELLDVR